MSHEKVMIIHLMVLLIKKIFLYKNELFPHLIVTVKAKQKSNWICLQNLT